VDELEEKKIERHGGGLFPGKRHQAERAGTLDRLREIALMARAHARVAGIDDLPLGRNESAEKLYVLVVDLLDVLRAEKALFGGFAGHKFRMEYLLI
jgi:hypothetical protein